jgi:hypothetical protein
MKKLAIVAVVAAVFASTAAVSVKHQRRWTEKLDVALIHGAEEAVAQSVQLVIWVRPGAADRIMSHLTQHGLRPEHATTPDVVTVQMPASMVRSVAGDADVVRLSPKQ